MAGLLPASWLKFDLTGTNLVFILPEDQRTKKLASGTSFSGLTYKLTLFLINFKKSLKVTSKKIRI